MPKSKPKDVDDYISNAPEEARSHLEELREIMKSTIPNVQEGISWNVPFYKYEGQVGGFDAFKNHASFGPWCDEIDPEIRKTLEKKGYTVLKRTIQIKYDQKVPTAEIKKILREIVKTNEAKKAAK